MLDEMLLAGELQEPSKKVRRTDLSTISLSEYVSARCLDFAAHSDVSSPLASAPCGI